MAMLVGSANAQKNHANFSSRDMDVVVTSDSLGAVIFFYADLGMVDGDVSLDFESEDHVSLEWTWDQPHNTTKDGVGFFITMETLKVICEYETHISGFTTEKVVIRLKPKDSRRFTARLRKKLGM